MKTRLSAVAGFLTAATLLSGSAFAFAPEFTGDIPTVIITDRITDSVATDLFDAPNGAANIPGRESSAFLFRFDNAIDAASIVDVKDAGSLANVKVVFTEYTDDQDVTPNTVKTLSINGKVAVDDVPVDAADFDSSVAFDLSDPLLDFRNIDFSPGTGLGPFTNIGQVTGDDILASYPQSRVVTMHLGSDSFTDRGAASDKSFLVVTTLDDNDRVTDATVSDPFVPIMQDGGTNGSNFDGYEVGAYTTIPSVNNGAYDGSDDIVAANINGMAVTDPTGVTLAANATTAIPASSGAVAMTTVASSNNAQTGIIRISKAATEALTAGDLYRCRMNAQLDAAATNADVYLQFGSEFTAGGATAGFVDAGFFTSSSLQLPAVGTTDTEVDAYLLAKADMIADYNTLFVQVVDYNPNGGAALTVNGIELAVAEGGMANYGTGTVLVNMGGAVTPATGEPAAPAGQTAFASGTTPGDNINVAIETANTGVTTTCAVTASALTCDMSGPAGNYWDYSQFTTATADTVTGTALDLDLLDTGLALNPAKLYELTVYASAETPEVAMPALIPFVKYDYTGLAGTKYNTGRTDAATTGPTAPAAETLLATDDKAYSVVFTPQTGNVEAKTQIGVQLYYVSGAAAAGSTISISRIVLTEYDM